MARKEMLHPLPTLCILSNHISIALRMLFPESLLVVPSLSQCCEHDSLNTGSTVLWHCATVYSLALPELL